MKKKTNHAKLWSKALRMTTCPLFSLLLLLLLIELVIKLTFVNDLYTFKPVASPLTNKKFRFPNNKTCVYFFSWRVTDIKNEQY